MTLGTCERGIVQCWSVLLFPSRDNGRAPPRLAWEVLGAELRSSCLLGAPHTEAHPALGLDSCVKRPAPSLKL